MAALKTILPYVLPELPAAPTPLILQYATKVLEDFCRKTKCWQTEEALPLVAGTRGYALTPPADARLSLLLTVALNEPLTPTTPDLLLQGNPNWQNDTGSPDTYFISLPLTLNLVPMPDASVDGDTLRARAVWVPAATATTWDDALFERHANVIAAGIKGQMMGMQGQPWSNPIGAAQYEGEYAEGRRNARIEASGGPQVRNVMVRKPRFV